MYRRLARFNRKAPTGVKPPYIVFNPHTLPPCVRSSEDHVMITAIDPGIKNCGLRVSIYSLVSGRSQTLLMCNLNFTHEAYHQTGSCGIETHYYPAIFTAFEPHRHYFIASQYICVESQLPINYDLVRMSQHIITYLMTMIRDQGSRPLIIELDPHTKTRMLGAPPRMTKPQNKAWCRGMAIYFLKFDGEFECAQFLEQQGKGDDMGDVVCYEKCMILILTQGICRLPLPTTIPKHCPMELEFTPISTHQVLNPFK